MLLTNTTPEIRGDSTELVVGLHAWTSSSLRLSDVRTVVETEMPNADLLFPNYPASVFSSADPIAITRELVAAISEAVESRNKKGGTYKQIILIGHSIGALFVRKAYVFARGQTQDMPGPLHPVPADWWPLVTRIILFGGMNRGWSLRKKARHLPWPRWLIFSLGAALWHWLRLGKLINAFREGAPFIVNLRIQWLNLVREANPDPPVTIQLLGDVDDIVAEDDNVDVESGANFIYREVRGTGHSNVIRFDGGAGRYRSEQFLYALTTPQSALKSVKRRRIEPDYEVQVVAFVMHGIRDFGFWTSKVGTRITEVANSKGIKAKHITSSYGYFPLIAFLVQPERQKNVRWFMDQYTEALAKYPKAGISFVGHSNGSYLLASALERYAACSFQQAVFAGSVVYRAFPWDQMINEKRVLAIQNYVATKDWVVAIFPKFFEFFHRSDIGSAGHDGFTAHEGQRHQVVFIRGSHSAALVEANFDAIAHYVLGDIKSRPPLRLVATEQAKWLVVASKLCWIIWLFLFCVALAPVGLSYLGYWPTGAHGYTSIIAWLVFLYALLRTI